MRLMILILFFGTDVPTESTEDKNNISITMLAVVVVCASATVFLIMIAAFVTVTCFAFKKKNKKRVVNLQEHVYESVLQPTTLVTFSQPAAQEAEIESIDSDLYDEVKTSGHINTTNFDLTDNKAYLRSHSAAAETPVTETPVTETPVKEAEVAPGTDHPE